MSGRGKRLIVVSDEEGEVHFQKIIETNDKHVIIKRPPESRICGWLFY